MTIYHSRPQEIEAVQWTGDNIDDIWDTFGAGKVYGPTEDAGLKLFAGKDGAQDWVPVPIGHWLVSLPGDRSDIWPVDPDYFGRKYEAEQNQ